MSTVDRLKQLKEKAKQKIAAATVQQETVEREKSLRPVYGRTINPSLLAGQPHVTTGTIGKDSAGYSYSKALAFAAHRIGGEYAKEEQEVSNRLRQFYGYMMGTEGPSIAVMASADPLYHPPQLTQDASGQSFLKEMRQKMLASVEKYDPDEAACIRQKSLGTFPATAGGTFIPPPQLSTDVIDLQRNREVFSRAGATQITFPQQGAISFPRQTAAGTAYWVGEGRTITSSDATTGQLDLRAKKLAMLCPLTIEGSNFSNPSLELLIRNDMAKTAALKADNAMLEGVGSTTSIRGVINYTGDSNSYLNINTVVATTVGTNGNTVQPQDVLRMFAQLPDAVDDQTVKWVMHPAMWAVLANRRADAVSASDAAGPFMFNIVRDPSTTYPKALNGYEVITSRQCSQNRVKGSGTDLNYIVLGHFPDWMIARYGMMEVLMNPWSDTAYSTGIVQLRAMQFIDAGPRTPNSFVFMDTLLAS